MHVHDTTNTDDESKLWLWLDEVVASVASLATEVDQGALLRAVLLDVLLSSLESLSASL